MANNKPIVIITGASGFVGTFLTEYFTSKGWLVRALVRDPSAHSSREGVTPVRYELGQAPDAAAFTGADYLIHTAYMKYDRKHPDAFEINQRAAQQLLKASRKHGLKKNVFMSSMSAHDNAVSVYGKQKLAIEKLFSGNKDVSLRSGLIIGAGGIVQQMAGFMRSKHIVPLIDSGKQPLQVIAVYDLARVIERSLTSTVHGVLTIATPEVYSYKRFYQALASRIQAKIFFIHVPFIVLLSIIRFVNFLHLPLSIGEDNLWGLKKLVSADTASDLKKLSLTIDNLETALAKSEVA